VSNDVLTIFQQGFAQRGTWEEIPSSIEWNELKTIKLNIFVKHTKHQPQEELKFKSFKCLLLYFSCLSYFHIVM
jgi:hypothetical protein